MYIQMIYCYYISSSLYGDLCPTMGTPKWMVYDGETLLKWMIWGYPHFRRHPYSSLPMKVVIFQRLTW